MGREAISALRPMHFRNRHGDAVGGSALAGFLAFAYFYAS
jgi:hypothetical protein